MPHVSIGRGLSGSEPPIIIKTDQRRQHALILGKTGVGKSTLASNMVISDLRNDAGVCVIDPHGDTIETLLQYIPKHRTNQVVYISPADEDFPVGLNFLEPRAGQPNHLVVSELVSSVRHLWSSSWGPQSEFILANAVAAAMDIPGATLLEVYRMLLDPTFRSRVVPKIQNPICEVAA